MTFVMNHSFFENLQMTIWKQHKTNVIRFMRDFAPNKCFPIHFYSHLTILDTVTLTQKNN